MALFSRTTSRYKTFWILMKQEMIRWQWHQLDHMQITCTLLQTNNHASISSINILRDWMPFLMPNQRHQMKQSFLIWLLRPSGSVIIVIISVAKHCEQFIPYPRKTS